MPTPAEHRALLFVAVVAALGVGVRGLGAVRRDEPPRGDREALARQLAAVDSAIATGGRRRAPATTAPMPPSAAGNVTKYQPFAPPAGGGPAAPVDVDVAPAADLERLPGIGPTLAARIEADREAHGPYGSLGALQRVKGVGPALAARIAPHVTFSLQPRPSPMGVSVPEARRP